jgi:hypothetical protein
MIRPIKTVAVYAVHLTAPNGAQQPTNAMASETHRQLTGCRPHLLNEESGDAFGACLPCPGHDEVHITHAAAAAKPQRSYSLNWQPPG